MSRSLPLPLPPLSTITPPSLPVEKFEEGKTCSLRSILTTQVEVYGLRLSPVTKVLSRSLGLERLGPWEFLSLISNKVHRGLHPDASTP